MESLTTTFVSSQTTGTPASIKLGAIDQIAPRCYMYNLMFFRLPHDLRAEDKHRIFQHLHQGLRRTIEEIPQLLCTVAYTDNEREELELRYDRAHPGSLIVFRDYTSPGLRSQWPYGSFEDLEREHFPATKIHPSLVASETCTAETVDERPTFVVQANFIQGGLLLSESLNHTVCDGVSMWHVTQILARHVAAASKGTLASPTATSPSPIFRARPNMVRPDFDNVKLDQFPDWKLVRQGDKFLDPTADGVFPEVSYSTFFINEKNISLLKDRLRGAQGEKLSAIEVVAAFVWSNVLRARNVDLNKFHESKLSLTVNARGRMSEPSIPDYYWGNMCEPNAVARMPTSDLCASPGDEHHYWSHVLPIAAQRVRHALVAVDNTAVRRLVGLLEQMPTVTSLTWNVDRWPGPDMLIVIASRYLYNQLDFGADLKSSDASRFTVGNTAAKPDGRVFFLPPRPNDGRGLEVMLQYDLQTLDRLKNDATFTRLFEWRN